MVETAAHDVKLVLDGECQKVAEEVIAQHSPDHGILGEEGRSEEVPSGWVWVIDPIDGTVNYSHGLDWWCSSVAVAHHNTVVAGAVYLPALGHMYTATLDGPACLNDEVILASEVPSLDRAMIATGLSRTADPHSPSFPMFGALSGQVQKIRLMGAAAIDLCHVAAGKIDGYFESSIYWWDIAAAGLIAERAGAVTERLEEYGDYRMRYMAANRHIRTPFRDVYNDVMKTMR